MLSTAIEPTARNSDCQFWNVVCQKWALPTYSSQLSGSSSCSSCSALYELQPVTECANQEARKIVPITSSSEFDSSHSRTPRARAHFGACEVAWPPTFCSSSDSVPALWSSFDSGDPFCTSHTVAKMNRKNCRYSDCQFSITAWPNDDETM